MISLEKNKAIDKLLSFGVKAETYRYFRIKKTSDLYTVLKSNSLPLRVLGGGSNILWTKKFQGLLLHIDTKGISVEDESDSHVIINIQAGENWHQIVLWALKNNYGGIENLALIPGSVGAAPIQNIGAYGVELKEVFIECTAINTETLKSRIFSLKECKFNYRDSIFKNQKINKYIITSVKIKLTKKGYHKLSTNYGDIRKILGSDVPSPSKIAKAVIKIRKSKLPDPKIMGNCGSFFKNPIINKKLFDKILTRHPKIPNYLVNKKYKIPAAWLIEKLNLKGYREGNVGTHKDQALIIVNYGNSSGSDILKLSSMIQKEVYECFEIKLVPEVVIW
ncbi:MAG: UDP-N-acetylenolpyruvoylglucosamine reductase [Flavobacteriaceae bacterium]|nr:UDP-N-acetylenolpyruvoylglucosamine reductase [Flavobacteriaceae bacterium]|tara:strand:- start:1394 stop:2398 length:1005 start_codon:yes stop_codon:yes gene_type:complete